MMEDQNQLQIEVQTNDSSTSSNDSQVDSVKQHHKQLFETWLQNYYNSTSKTTSYVVDSAKRDKIFKYLKGEINAKHPDYNSNFKHSLSKKNYSIQVIDNKEILYRLDDENVFLPVAIKENFFDIIYEIHSLQRGHVGQNKTGDLVCERYHCIARKVAEQFVQLCAICNLKTIQRSQPRLKPIRSEDFLARFQIDLIDMRHNSALYNKIEYKWISHVVDHFSKFHFLWGQSQKEAVEVVDGLERFVFAYVGISYIFQSDNGLEFKNRLVQELIKSWEGEAKIIYGRARHPQSQGLVEQSNGTIERMIASMSQQFHGKNWYQFLPKIMFNLNTQKSSSTKFSPYEIVFNRKPNIGSSKKFYELDLDKNEEKEITETETNTQIQTQTDTQPQTETNTQIQTQTDTQPQTETNTQIQTQPQTQIQTQTDTSEDELISPLSSISSIRSQVVENQTKSAGIMEKKHNHKRNKRVRSFTLGEPVSVLIFKLDRGGSDLPRLPGVISRVCSNQLFEITCKFGVLNDCLGTEDIEPYNGLIEFDYKSIKNRITIREAARKISNRDKDLKEIEVKCNCNGKCLNDKRCSCFAANVKCNSHCHKKNKSSNCVNKD